MINESQYYNWSKELLESADKLTINMLSRVRAFAIRAVDRPETLTAFERRIAEQMRKDVADFGRAMREFSDDRIAKAYIAGLKEAERAFDAAGETASFGRIPGVQVFTAGLKATETQAAIAALTQAGYASHSTYVSAFISAYQNDGRKMLFQILRTGRDDLARIQLEAGSQQFLRADTLTRRAFTQDIVERIADRGITAITYASGRQMPVEAYAEMLARTTLGNAARQAGVNRSSELGNNLVRISSHARCSPMCLPHQGKVHSIDGSNPNYPTLQSAIDQGFAHPACKHSVSPYFEGISPALEPDGAQLERELGDKKTYRAEQMQRYNERQIRHWKKREAVAVEDSAKQKAVDKVKAWQARQREFLDDNPYLRRQYAREQI